MNKIIVCSCSKCKYAKAKRKSKNLKKILKRLVNNQRRRGKIGKIYNHYWA